MNIGYTHGRYQPLHNGHFNTMLYILNKYDNLWIGISNPIREYPQLIDKSDNKLLSSIERARSKEKNPYSFLERYEMIFKSLIEYGINPSRIRILPHFAFYDIKNWIEFLPSKEKSVIVLSAKDYHHYEKIDLYKELGWEVEFVEPTSGVSGDILDSEYPYGNWRNLVPSGTEVFLEND